VSAAAAAPVLLTGATGYVGGRLLAALEARGLRVRCLSRRPDVLRTRVGPGTELVAGDVRDTEAVRSALRGARMAYYLVHSMGSGELFEERDREAARAFAAGAAGSGIERIVYLGGLAQGRPLSPHLRSREETGRCLRASGVPVLELRASIIVGSGSASFEMLRALVERLPVMVTPRWTRIPTQPIAVEDVIDYLVAAAEVPLASSRVVEIGGADVVSYHELMLEYARLRGLRRLIVPVPLLTPRLSGLWLRLVTPLYAHVGRALLESIRNETTVNDPSALGLFGVRPRGVAEAISRALSAEDEAFARTRWCDALAEQAPPYGGVRFGRRLVDSRAVQVPVPPQAAFVPIARIGGDTGWYHAGRLLRLRGLLDLLAGGVGTRRGRPWPDRLHVGDTVDFWRVEAVEPARLLRLAAEMKVPGRAWLQFEVMPRGDGSTIRQTAIFDPAGPTGLLYWYALYPLHALVFRGMLRGIAAAAVRGAGETSGRSGHAGGARA